jgi:Tfp pilus assembly protein PilF
MSGGPVDPAMLAIALRHFEADRFGEAESACRAILSRAPNDFWTLRLLGGVYSKQGNPAEATQALRTALVSGPPDEAAVVAVMNELAAELLEQQHHDAALECYRLAAGRKPDDAATRQNHGTALVRMNRHADALVQYRIARKLMPESAELRFIEGATRIALGDWPAGWDLLEARLSTPHLLQLNPFAQSLPRWDGNTDIRGKTILLQAEQGLGDVLQFVRYAPLVAARGARVVVRVQPQLSKLLADLPGADSVTTIHDQPAGIDTQCVLMSLPSLFRTTVDTVPAQIPYLRLAPEYRMLWEALLGPRSRRRIGFVWSGRHGHMPLRSMPLAALAPLLARQDCEFHVLQKEIAAADRAWLAAHPAIVDHSDQLRDFTDTAAIASLMDLVLTVDTSVAHMAGALGLPVWIMLPFSADSRWMIGRSNTPWYPTARLFRQKRLGDWDGVVAQVLRDVETQ